MGHYTGHYTRWKTRPILMAVRFATENREENVESLDTIELHDSSFFESKAPEAIIFILLITK